MSAHGRRAREEGGGMDRVVLQDVHGASVNGAGSANETAVLEEMETDGAVAGLDQRISLPGVPGVKGMGWLRDYPDIRDYTPPLEQDPHLLGLGGSRTRASSAPAPPRRAWAWSSTS